MSEALLFIKEQRPTLNKQGQSIALTLAVKLNKICSDLYYLTKSEDGHRMTAKILNLNFNIRKWNVFSF